MAKTADIERILAAAALPGLAVEETGDGVMLTGIVTTEDEHQRALSVVNDAGVKVEDNIEVLGVMPATIDELQENDQVRMDVRDRDLESDDVSEAETDMFEGATEGFEEVSLEAGDFSGEEHVTTAAWESSGPTSAIDEDIVSEGDTVFSPPTDPVVQRDPVTLRERVIGGFSSDSMESIEVERSALDHEYGDEAIADAVRRELLEDSATTDLDEVNVHVFEGVVTLRGRVPLLIDSDNAAEVASRVPGVQEVREELDVEQYES